MQRTARRGRPFQRGSGLSPSLPDKSKKPEPSPNTSRRSGGHAARTDEIKGSASQAVEVPQPIQEVVLNARGMPARQRKKNRFYYDDNFMVNPVAMKSKSHPKKIKAEPIEVEEVDTTGNFPFNVPTASNTILLDATLPSDDEITPDFFSESEPTVSSVIRRQARNSSAISPRIRYRHEETIEEMCTALLASSSPVPIHKGRGRKKKDVVLGNSGVEKRRKTREEKSDPLARFPTDLTTKKPRMQYIRIKREPDMSFGSPVHVAQDNLWKLNMSDTAKKTGFNHKDGDFPPDVITLRRPYTKSDDKIVKFDTDLGHGSGVKGQFGFDEYSNFGTRKVTVPTRTLDKKTAHDISIRLRNLLKLPKAHKWVCYEWFYSNIDRVLFEGENDFQICLKESFPQLKVRQMTRVEWCKIRRLMGKPRRCSQSFFDEEREELCRRRHKIRMIQQRKITDFSYKELPDEIPLQLVVGTKVTSRLRKPQDGLFTGTIDGVDTSNNTYRITFDRPGLGTHSIPDYEVLSNDPPETVSTSSFVMKIPRRNFSGFGLGHFKYPQSILSDDGLGYYKSPFPIDGMLGGFPIRLLDMIVRLSKLLKSKREKILVLKELNVEAEKLYSYGKPLNAEYRLRYAHVVVDMEAMNKEMAGYLEGVQQYCVDIAPDHGLNQMIIPEVVQESCRQEAIIIVDTYNTNKNRCMVHGDKPLQLIADFTSLLLQVKALGTGERSLYELRSIKDTLTEVKGYLSGKNVQLFQDRIEIPMNQIHLGLTFPALRR